ncbi:type II secretion system minor pseudopilin [Paracraurococcus lichenis]|uniref:Type II secretion system protein GspK n=1 Tax=Paracraurococcus lichenis TaxID=3064888 RepID=A0ABT9E7Y0_9PROT|nr:type II secretion system protein GspK [Paracraurococcus sp. LOR1-02]MDO9712284.1 type II secretion system protein GspK [Paracraurococcus sp. LOR1-02]
MTSRGTGRERGFALLLVLWSMALLALLGTQVVATGRSELQLAGNLRGAAAAEAAADGAVHAAVFRLLDPSPQRWLPDGLAREMRLPGGAVAVVRVESEQGKVNPNLAPLGLMQALLVEIGAEPRAATSLAAAMLDWRSGGIRPRPGGAKEPQYRAAGRDYAPPGRPFQTIEELGLVLGMTPALLARLAPHLSLYQGGDPDLRFASPLVLAALRATTDPEDAGDLGGEPDSAPVVAITAAVTLPGGVRFVRQAHVRLGQGTRGRPWQILGWRAIGDD